jgi:hypothetical protein
MLSVRLPEWELHESGRILGVGEEHAFWLTFREVEGASTSADAVNLVHGVAVPLPDWPGAELGRHPVRIDIDGGALYRDAPEPIIGRVEVAGTVTTNDVDAPEGFPETACVLRRLRMEWQDFVISPQGRWTSAGEGTRYEEVTSTQLPADEHEPVTPEVEAGSRRRARHAYEREVTAGRLGRGDTFEVGLKVSGTARGAPPGTTEMRWTGVLTDLETVGLVQQQASVRR